MLDTARYHIQLDIFEGPMDLLVHLIRKHEIDIHDIPIALITDQYLAYLDWMEQTQVSPAGDFLVMAATLIQIKSALLLPRPVGDTDDAADPRMDLVRPLAEYLQMKHTAEQLAALPVLGREVFARPAGTPPAPAGHLVPCDLFTLALSYADAIRSVPPAHTVQTAGKRLSVKAQIQKVMHAFTHKRMRWFHELAPPAVPLNERIVTFLALLEMAKQNLVRLRRQRASGVLRIFSFLSKKART